MYVCMNALLMMMGDNKKKVKRHVTGCVRYHEARGGDTGMLIVCSSYRVFRRNFVFFTIHCNQSLGYKLREADLAEY